MTRNKTKILAATGAAALVVAMIFFILKCSSPQPARQTPPEISPEQSAEKILREHAVYDQRSLSELAQAINSDKEFNAEDISLMIVAVEAAIDRFSQELEFLDANNDAADSWNVIAENSKASWTHDVNIIYPFLVTRAPLTDSQRERMELVNKTISRVNDMISNIEQTQFNGKSTGLTIGG